MQNEEFRKLLLAYPSKAIKLLYQTHYKPLVGLAFKFVRDKKIAEDIVQETFVHIWENYKKLGQYHKQSIQYYLVTVVKNKAVSEYRKMLVIQQNKASYLRDTTDLLLEGTVEMSLIRQENSDHLRKLIATFPKRERECLGLKLNDEMNTEQIAITLKVSRKAAERSITSGYKRLFRFLFGNM